MYVYELETDTFFHLYLGMFYKFHHYCFTVLVGEDEGVSGFVAMSAWQLCIS